MRSFFYVIILVNLCILDVNSYKIQQNLKKQAEINTYQVTFNSLQAQFDQDEAFHLIAIEKSLNKPAHNESLYN
jgi:hypothetical protein